VLYATSGLVDALLDIAAERDPTAVTVALTTRPAGELDGPTDLAADKPVFTDFYLPETGGSVRAVFGMDLGTPSARGRFVSHPTGPLELTREDDLHEVVFVAVPPYDRESLRAFDRGGSRLQLTVLDAAPPEVPFDG
jgi:hypothetical protein